MQRNGVLNAGERVSSITLFNASEEDCPCRKRHKTLNNIVLEIDHNKAVVDDSFTIDFPDKRTMRIRSNYEGVRNATTYILEKHFGVRFLMRFPTYGGRKRPAGYPWKLDYHYPRAKNVSVPRKTVKLSPSVNLKRSVSSN